MYNQDLTAACILEGFRNETALKNADRVIKQMGNEAAAARFPVHFFFSFSAS